ncbi:ABC transporter permease [Iamia sp. SCSIO 61187]|uniref:ABC transporter permease n=1 Tax=Iamia sp. SCSIO 61187 TaxID=2722752 RepID=UPI001C628710|nr:ABC transporter permease [Iamia sp. SCSIO 61187]QYG94045.1 ABC transporter permease [Iamia sp. SCSIO 61187]
MTATAVDTPRSTATNPVTEVGAAPRSRPNPLVRALRTLSKALGPLAVLLVACGIWYVITYVVLPSHQRFLLPPPHEVVQDGFLDSRTRGELLRGLLSTTRVALSGLTLAFVLGTTFAIVMAQARWIERSFYPYAVILQTIPVLALTPLVGLWMGFNFRSRVLICTILALFPIITNTLFGLRSTAQAHHELFSLHTASRWTRLVRLQLPSALPSVFTGLRTSAGLSVIGAIVADFFFRQGEKGIGRLLDVYRSQLATDKLIAGVMCSASLGVAVFLVITVVSNRALRSWHDSARP